MSPLSFSSLELPGPVRRGIEDAGFVATTAIQEAALPLALRGKDVAGQSQTGTGKTAAFLIAAFTRCLTHAPPARGGVTAPRVALAFSLQILDSLPVEPHDEPVDWIVTEGETIACRAIREQSEREAIR